MASLQNYTKCLKKNKLQFYTIFQKIEEEGLYFPIHFMKPVLPKLKIVQK